MINSLIWNILQGALKQGLSPAMLAYLAGLLAPALGIPAERLSNFLLWLRTQTDETISEIEKLLGFEISFGSTAGEGLTNAMGECPPDCCPECEEYKDVILALWKARQEQPAE